MPYDRHRPSDLEAPLDAAGEDDEDLAADGPEDETAPSPGPTVVPISALRDPEVPEADALEQARDIPYDDEYLE